MSAHSSQPFASLFDPTTGADLDASAAAVAADLGDGAVRAPALADDLQRLGRRLPSTVYLGTSSWSFPGWRGLVYDGVHSESKLARDGLTAYAQHPVLRCVGIARSFYQPLPAAEFARYAAQVPAGFRFVVKAPALFCDAVVRDARGAPARPNPHFLDAAAAAEQFIGPALDGLGPRCGPLVFALSPLPPEMLASEALPANIERLGEFLAALPRGAGMDDALVLAVEPRNPELLTPRFVRMLAAVGARLCLGVHARMPEVARQSAALRAMDAGAEAGADWRLQGPLVVRWSLHAGLHYEQARNRYAPFDRLIDTDVVTRGVLTHLVHVAQRSHQSAFVIVNNKAEGCAPASCIELARAIVD